MLCLRMVCLGKSPSLLLEKKQESVLQEIFLQYFVLNPEEKKKKTISKEN